MGTKLKLNDHSSQLKHPPSANTTKHMIWCNKDKGRRLNDSKIFILQLHFYAVSYGSGSICQDQLLFSSKTKNKKPNDGALESRCSWIFRWLFQWHGRRTKREARGRMLGRSAAAAAASVNETSGSAFMGRCLGRRQMGGGPRKPSCRFLSLARFPAAGERLAEHGGDQPDRWRETEATRSFLQPE